VERSAATAETDLADEPAGGRDRAQNLQQRKGFGRVHGVLHSSHRYREHRPGLSAPGNRCIDFHDDLTLFG